MEKLILWIRILYVCADETYECEHLIICTGSQTVIPPIQGIDQVSYWTHRDALDNKELPRSLAIVGGGVIGMEFASFFSSFGSTSNRHRNDE